MQDAKCPEEGLGSGTQQCGPWIWIRNRKLRYRRLRRAGRADRYRLEGRSFLNG
jgi:hypothetical protein